MAKDIESLDKKEHEEAIKTSDEEIAAIDELDSSNESNVATSKENLVTSVSGIKKKPNKLDDNRGVPKEPKVGFMKLVSHYFVKKWPIGLLILLMMLIAGIATAAGPFMMNSMTKVITWKSDTHIPGFDVVARDIPYDQLPSNMKPIWDISWQAYMGIQIGLFVLIAATTLTGTMLAGFLGKYIEVDLRNKTIARLITQDMSYYSDKKIGDLLTKVVSDTQNVGDQSQAIPTAFLSALFTTVFALVFGFVINWQLSLVIIVMFLLILVFMGLIFTSLRKLMFNARDVITKVNGTVINRINTVQLIKTSGTEEYEKEGFAKDHVEYADAYKKVVTVQSMMITVLIMGISSIQVVLVVAAGIMYRHDTTTLINVLPSFLLLAGIMIGPLMQVIRVTAGIVIASTSAERIAEILYSKSRINAHLKENEGIYINEINGDILFKDVVFAYPEKPSKVILPKTDFTFKEGKSYAFVGETGAGKSTISKLLLRFYDPTYGEVLINNDINLKDIHLSSYLEHVGYVEQEPQILLGNIWENVRYGTEGKTDEEVIEACKKADLDGIISQWPKGYDTILGERGFMLSGGQKQRLVIARMFLKDPQLLILDEATSALDNIVEKEIQGKLNELMKNRTTVSIAHRLSTIKNADQIIVLAPGEGVTQIGTFDELKTQPGHFKELYEAGLMK
ncbi:ABC transporter ATP-binding protein [Mesoplasma lactucae]|uniref:ABC transporter ATP-binding protein n=1 Tax=Mesoplasma lactucae ATCC 49193 TaxID=81460 RepID=A0A291IRK2_9MOLU|nr:ABC transporter ATP-binding protein [Mesoplasma lactucae]ATG97321.1 ABC transporter ATP-binding protein [Mesoplasma lactucae ATCC 49193]ATZ20228.1 ABC transporter ATP-binding protein [Mesoplasma lactucae ATCC 49193]MCL8216977.1 Vitamin B12 import ATP-binding protein BtuD [Mesoplasma lactucae ATCC 49193]